MAFRLLAVPDDQVHSHLEHDHEHGHFFSRSVQNLASNEHESEAEFDCAIYHSYVAQVSILCDSVTEQCLVPRCPVQSGYDLATLASRALDGQRIRAPPQLS